MILLLEISEMSMDKVESDQSRLQFSAADMASNKQTERGGEEDALTRYQCIDGFSIVIHFILGKTEQKKNVQV